MISKLAVQIGLGIGLIGGVGGGIIALQLSKATKILTLQEFIVATTETINSTHQPTTQPKEKNYFCQWGMDENKKIDNNCLIQKIKLDTNKKSISFGDLTNEGILEIPKIIELGTKNHLFKLSITSYDGEIASLNEQINILSTTKEKDDSNKKYGFVKTIARLSHQQNQTKVQQDIIKTGTFITSMKNNPTLDNLIIANNSTYKCKWIPKTKIVTSTIITANDLDFKPCNVYAFDEDNDNITSITSNSDFQKDVNYTINFIDDLDFKPISELLKQDGDLVVVYVEIKNKTISEIGQFYIQAPLIGNITSILDDLKFIVFHP